MCDDGKKRPHPALAVWHEIVAAVPDGVLQESDRFVVEVAATILARFREMRGVVSASEVAQLHRALASLGMTPADRSKVGVGEPDDEPKEADPWDSLGPAPRPVGRA